MAAPGDLTAAAGKGDKLPKIRTLEKHIQESICGLRYKRNRQDFAARIVYHVCKVTLHINKYINSDRNKR
jgi:hypothetical protein